MKGLAPHTQQIFEAVSKLDCIKPYLLVGGTALSLQIGTRQQTKKKALAISRKCLILNVDQPGLEPGTSRL